jgi:hypothetical protein
VTPRIDYRQFSEAALQAMLALEQYLAGCGFDHKFMHLLKLRESQINGCAYRIDMNSINERATGGPTTGERWRNPVGSALSAGSRAGARTGASIDNVGTGRR